MTTSERVSDIRGRRLQGLIGGLVFTDFDCVKLSMVNSGQVKQVTTITVTDATNSATYTITVNGVDVQYTADSSTSTTEIATGLAAAVNAEPLVRGQVVATSSSAVITLTGAYPGVAFTVTESESDLGTPSTTTAAASAATVGFGLAIMQTGIGNDPAEPTPQGAQADVANFTAQVDTWTITYVADERIGLAVNWRGTTYTGEVVSATDRSTTMTALAAKLNAILPANTVLAAGTATGVTLTAEVVGEEFTSRFVNGDGGASDATGTLSTNKGIATSARRAIKGVSMRDRTRQATTPGSSATVYEANATMIVVSRGDMWVSNSEGVTYGSDVYVELSGASKGTFLATPTSTSVWLPGWHWERDGRTADNQGIAHLRVAA